MDVESKVNFHNRVRQILMFSGFIFHSLQLNCQEVKHSIDWPYNLLQEGDLLEMLQIRIKIGVNSKMSGMLSRIWVGYAFKKQEGPTQNRTLTLLRTDTPCL